MSTGVGIFLFDFDTIPDPGSSASDIVSFYAKNLDQWRFANLLLIIGVGFLMWFMGSLRHRVAIAEGHSGRMASLAYGGGLLTAFLYLLAFSTSNGLPDDIGKFDDTTVLAYHAGVQVLHNPLLGASTVTRTILLTAVAFPSLRLAAMPKWFGWFTLALAVTSGLGVFAYLGVGGIENTIWYIAYSLFPAWVLIASIILIVKPGSPDVSREDSRTS